MSGVGKWAAQAAAQDMKKLEDKWNGWKQVQNIHIFLFVQYVCEPALLIEGRIFGAVWSSSAALHLQNTHRQVAVSYSAGQHYDIGVCIASHRL